MQVVSLRTGEKGQLCLSPTSRIDVCATRDKCGRTGGAWVYTLCIQDPNMEIPARVSVMIFRPSILRRAAYAVFIVFLGVAITLTALHFPRTTDQVAARFITDADYRRFYEHAYAARKAMAATNETVIEKSYEVRADSAPPADSNVDADPVQAFVRDYRLGHKRILEVGSGAGSLQDVVPNYTGLDISASAARFYRKPFVQGSATELPFPDNSFDAIWTINVLEHVPRPESALYEMRRVLRPNGYLFLSPAWQCRSWAADGYAVRPYSDFGFVGRIVKASVPVRDSVLYRLLYIAPIRALRLSCALFSQQPTVFRYNELEPNYRHYWTSDSDAVNSMDAFEAILWFRSRGDKCLNYPNLLQQFTVKHGAVVIQIRK